MIVQAGRFLRGYAQAELPRQNPIIAPTYFFTITKLFSGSSITRMTASTTDHPLASRDEGKDFGGESAADEGENGYGRDCGPYRDSGGGDISSYYP